MTKSNLIAGAVAATCLAGTVRQNPLEAGGTAT
ncbi:hypothetical protein DFP92_1274 [Yoonia sediminilitoris]|uniref:Uncharacterized protein n=1 Tax=Yoonia sediminilitoris TaxID=1286148 RepID=A0A2T6K4V6_9RHOB|nr:hypothetical protein C8N45_12718 [Yoonia sediminilitoris]RCW89523.1 hypothetical protein DFP92_1274 [Yoonia sediminilitoris]